VRLIAAHLKPCPRFNVWQYDLHRLQAFPNIRQFEPESGDGPLTGDEIDTG
jgi:hypothetical protein